MEMMIVGSGKEKKLNIIGLIKRKCNIKENLGNLSKFILKNMM